MLKVTLLALVAASLCNTAAAATVNSVSSAALSSRVSSETTIPGVISQPATAYRFLIGDARVTALSDGTMPMDVHLSLKGVAPAEMDALLAKQFLANPVQPSVNAYLIETSGRTVLVDTGCGIAFGRGNAGRLQEALAIAGIRPEQITDILITHAHPDHIGGLIADGRPVFTNATVHIGRPEVAFLLDPAVKNEQPLAKLIGAMVGPYQAAGRLKTFDRDGAVLPGISAELRPGHSPGSAIFRLESKGQSLVILGDVIHVSAVQLPRPDVTFAKDDDPVLARSDREDALRRFASQRTLIASPHINFPGVGHIIAASEGGYRWIPIDYGDHDPSAPPVRF